MSKESNTPLVPLIIDDNTAQVIGNQNIVDNHDKHAVHLLRREQAKVNRKLKHQRQEVHHEYEAIEAQAHAILQRAHQEGEIHIASRHSTTPMFFYFLGNKLMVWSEGKSEKIDVIKNFGANSMFRVSEYTMDIQGNSVDGAIATMIYIDDTTQKELLIVLIGKSKDGKYWTKKVGYQSLEDPKNNVADLIFSDEGVYGCSWLNSKIDTWKPDETPGKATSILAHSSVPSPYRSVVLYNDKTNLFFLIDKSRILSIPRIHNQKITTEILAEGITEIPIDLAYHSNHTSLLIQDAGKKEIGWHLLDAGKDRTWRSLKVGSQITLNQGVFQSDRTFTISCLLKRNCKQLLTDAPISADPFKIWVDKTSGLLNLQYVHNKKTYKFVSPEGSKLTDYQYSDWFLFSMQKEGDEIRFYIDGKLFCSFQTENFPSVRTAEKVLFSIPGFFICELRVWRTVRTPQQLMQFKRTWIPHSEYEGLTGYWHLFVMGKGEEATGLTWETFDENGNVTKIIQEPDLTGNGNHLVTNSHPLKDGDLNHDTVVTDKAPNPFPKVISIYEFGVVQQGLQIDDNTGLIYWLEEIGDTCNRTTVMMVGSALGHLAPRVIFELNKSSGFSMISPFNSMYEKLIIAHSERRVAMQKQILGIGDEHRTAHTSVDTAHQNLDDELTKSEITSMDNSDNSEEYAKVHDDWLAEMNRIAQEEENVLRVVSNRRNRAIEQARGMTDIAHSQVSDFRRIRD